MKKNSRSILIFIHKQSFYSLNNIHICIVISYAASIWQSLAPETVTERGNGGPKSVESCVCWKNYILKMECYCLVRIRALNISHKKATFTG